MFFQDGDLLNYSRDGVRLYPRMFSRTDFARRFVRLFRENRCLYLLFSPGLGYGLEALLEHGLPPASRLLIFEQDPRLLALYHPTSSPIDGEQLPREAASCRGLRDSLETAGDIAFCPSSQINAQRRWLAGQLKFPGPQRRVRALRFCTVPPDARDRYSILEADAGQITRQWWRNHSTTLFMAPLWIRNIFRNFRSLPESGVMPLGKLGKLLEGRNLALCGAGTSLDDAFATLTAAARLGDSWGIAAVDTAVPALLARDIVPELVIMLEAQFANMDDFICEDGFRRLNDAGSILIHDISAHPPTVRKFRRRMAFISRFAHSSLFPEIREITRGTLEEIPPLGSVGVSALYILLRYSSSPVSFCGFDFAFPPGRTHAAMSPAHQRVIRSAHRLQPVSAWGLMAPVHRRVEQGEAAPLISDDVMSGYFSRFSEVISLYGINRTTALAHHGLPFPGDLKLILTDEQASASAADRPAAMEALIAEGADVSTWLSEVSADIGMIKRSLARMLALYVPPESSGGAQDGDDALRHAWAGVCSLLEKRDFVWRFLPGVSAPEYETSFLSLLSGSLNYWSAAIERILRSGS
jgi:hypothetical protein